MNSISSLLALIPGLLLIFVVTYGLAQGGKYLNGVRAADAMKGIQTGNPPLGLEPIKLHYLKIQSLDPKRWGDWEPSRKRYDTDMSKGVKIYINEQGLWIVPAFHEVKFLPWNKVAWTHYQEKDGEIRLSMKATRSELRFYMFLEKTIFDACPLLKEKAKPGENPDKFLIEAASNTRLQRTRKKLLIVVVFFLVWYLVTRFSSL